MRTGIQAAPRGWLAVCPALVATALLVPAVFGPVEIFDEGFIASGAMMILRGALPIRDFFVIYGPGQYYLSAGAYAVFGEDLLVTRVLHLVVLGTLLAVMARLALQLAGGRWWAAVLAPLAAWPVIWVAQVAAGYAALPATLLLVAACPYVAAAALGGGPRTVLTGAVLIGVAGLFRWDFGLYGVIAAGGAVLLLRIKSGDTVARQALAPLPIVVPGVAILAVGFVPFIVVGDAARWWTEVPVFHAVEFKTWRNLEFLAPAWADLKSARSAWDASRAAARLSFAVLPVAAAGCALVLALPRCWRRDASSNTDAMAVVLALLTLMLFNQMRVRSHWPQGLPAYLCALPLMAYSASFWPMRAGAGALVWAWRAFLIVAVLVVPLYVVQGEIRAEGIPRSAEPVNDRARGVMLPPREPARQQWRDYQDLIRYVQAHTAPDEPIFSGVADTSRLFVNDALLYFLTDRPSATRWIEMEPGLTSGERGQREVIDELNRRRVRHIVLVEIRSSEPNATARSNGIDHLDGYIRSRYAPVARFGRYVVWLRHAD